MINRVMTFLVVLGLAAFAQAQTFTTLYSFAGGSDGGYLQAGVIQDPAGNLYGTAYEGGSGGYGVVYELSPDGTETALQSFSGSDGGELYAPVIRDNAGNIYGTTLAGGAHGGGTVFELDVAGKLTVLHSFTGGRSDGCHPYQGLVRDSAGTLYGTTWKCGTFNKGTVFKVDSAGTFSLLHSFAGSPADGAHPDSGHLTRDTSGNLYGATNDGGSHGRGMAYKLNKSGTLTVLHSFEGGTKDGCYPLGSVTQDNVGNLYGTTSGCGSTDHGTIWEVRKKGGVTILHSFAGGTSDGCYPGAGVDRDSKGATYGVTYGCGANNYGALYELSASGAFTVLHSFDLSDGAAPSGEVQRTTGGNLFGTAYRGGTDGYGTVWSYVP